MNYQEKGRWLRKRNFLLDLGARSMRLIFKVVISLQQSQLLIRRGRRINCVMPGFTDPRMQPGLRGSRPDDDTGRAAGLI